LLYFIAAFILFILVQMWFLCNKITFMLQQNDTTFILLQQLLYFFAQKPHLQQHIINATIK